MLVASYNLICNCRVAVKPWAMYVFRMLQVIHGPCYEEAIRRQVSTSLHITLWLTLVHYSHELLGYYNLVSFLMFTLLAATRGRVAWWIRTDRPNRTHDTTMSSRPRRTNTHYSHNWHTATPYSRSGERLKPMARPHYLHMSPIIIEAVTMMTYRIWSIGSASDVCRHCMQWQCAPARAVRDYLLHKLHTNLFTLICS